jgi:hypothetical protein
MAFHVELIKGALTFGGARSSHFSVYLQNPYDKAQALFAKTAFTIKAATLPSVEIGIVPFKYFGRDVKYAGDKTFPEWSVTVVNDEDFLVRAGFEKWSERINHPKTNLRSLKEGAPDSIPGTPSAYKADAYVLQYSKTGIPIRAYNLVGVWPSVVGDIEVSWDNENQIEEFPVTFQYDYWEKADHKTYTAVEHRSETP